MTNDLFRSLHELLLRVCGCHADTAGRTPLQTTTPQAPQAVQLLDNDRYFTPAALVASVASGAVALLRGRWLVELQRSGGRLERRQDLPAEAFLDVEELRLLIAALGDDWGLLLVAISYRCGRARTELLRGPLLL